MSPVDDDDKGPEDLTRDELSLLHEQMAGHRWHGWHRLTDDEDYIAACACGWRSTETGSVGPMLHEVKEHLDAARQASSGCLSAGRSNRAAQPPGRGEGEAGGAGDAGHREIQAAERARELYTAAEHQEARLPRAVERSGDLLSISQEQADRLVTALERAAYKLAPERSPAAPSTRLPEAQQREVERARQLRAGIVNSAAALGVIAKELVLLHQGGPARPPGRPAEVTSLADAGGRTAGRTGRVRAGPPEQADPDRDLLDGIVRRLLLVGLSLQSVACPSHGAAEQSITDALQGLDDTIRAVRDHVFATRSHSRPAGPSTRNGPG